MGLRDEWDETYAHAVLDGRDVGKHTLNAIRDTHAAVIAVPADDRAPADRVRDVVRRLCLDAWHREVEVDGRRGWDDAEWFQYLGLEDTLPWMAVALGLPGADPSAYGDLVEPVAWKVVPEPHQGWTWQEVPAEFVAELGDACVELSGLGPA